MNRDEALARLEFLTAAWCGDSGIRVEVTDGSWAFDAARNVILVSGDSLDKEGPDYCASVLAHEIGHCLITRYWMFEAPEGPPQVIRFLMNAVEDPRVDTWMGKRYPGLREWQRETYRKESQREDFRGTPRTFEFGHGAVVDAQSFDLGVLAGPRVRDILEATRQARRDYAGTAPPRAEGEPILVRGRAFEVLPRSYWELVHARVLPGTPLMRRSDHPEALARLAAWDALQILRGEILGPVMREIVDADIRDLSAWMLADRDNHRRVLRARFKKKDHEIVEIVREVFSLPEIPAHPDRPALGGAERLLDEWFRILLGRSAGQRRPAAGMLTDRPGLHASARAATSDRDAGRGAGASFSDGVLEVTPVDRYEERARALGGQIEKLVRVLEEELAPRARMRERSGYPSGSRVDMRRLMAFEADPRDYDKLWKRTEVPWRRETVFALLIDLSGSMEGPPIRHTVDALIVFVEALTRVGIRFSVDGFQDEVIPVVGMGQEIGAAERKAIAELVLEPEGKRPDGHNVPGCNDDGPCLEEVAQQVLAWPATDRVLVVLSDGQPAGRRSDEGDLRRVVAELSGRRAELELLGVGVGPGTEHVADFYPASRANVAPSRLGEVLGELVREGLKGQGVG